ncbi:MAG TPA: hypothetical protein VGM59_11005 [Dongiaceae bacterium]
MGKICSGGSLGTDWAVYTREDATVCVNSGGHVVDTGDGGCGATSVAAMAAYPGNPTQGAVAALALTPFKMMRETSAENELVKAVLELNLISAPEIERIAASDRSLQTELVEAFIALSGMAGAVMQKKPPKGKLDEATFARFEGLGRRFVKASKDRKFRDGVERVLGLAKPFVGKEFADIAKKLHGDQGGGEGGAGTGIVELQLPSAAAVLAGLHGHIVQTIATVGIDRGKAIIALFKLVAAERVIQAKAAALGWVGAPNADTEAVPGGYRQSFANADIMVGDSGVAYEVHGDIRAKYNMLGGPGGPLGLPVTDETGTPDGIGRYNHFQNDGSIYWTPNTGPMMVQGRVRTEWASQGWENGPMGYPVKDQQRMPALYPSDHPNLSWCLFQNGGLFAIAGAGATCVTADIPPDRLRTMIRSFFDTRLKAANGDLGLEAQTDLYAISDWSYGFWAAMPRMLTFGLHGFHDNGVLPDTTFDLQLRLRFSTTWQAQFTYPSSLSLIVTLDWVHVHTSGLGSGELADGLRDGIVGAFYRGGPDPNHPEVPDGAVFLTALPTGASQTGDGNLDVVDILTTAQGGIQILLNPLPPIVGGFRKLIAQQQVDAFLDAG